MKLHIVAAQQSIKGRPRKGAWIEIISCWYSTSLIESPPQGGVD